MTCSDDVGGPGVLLDERLDLHRALVLALGLLQRRLPDAGRDVVEERAGLRLRLGGARRRTRARARAPSTSAGNGAPRSTGQASIVGGGDGCGLRGRRRAGFVVAAAFCVEDLLRETLQLGDVAALGGVEGEALEVGDGARRVALLAGGLGLRARATARPAKNARRAS